MFASALSAAARFRAFPVVLAVGLTLVTWGLVNAAPSLLRQVSASGAAGLFPALPFLDGLVFWDSGWYAAIAESGYWYRPGQQSPVAFFPGYPMAIRAVASALGVHAYLAGVLISTVCGIASVLLFHRWAEAVAGPDHAVNGTFAIALFPYAFYLFGVMYAEAFFLTLVIAAFLCLERGNVWGAALFGALATFTRPVAPAILMGLLVRHWELKRRRGEPLRASDSVLLLAGAGMAAYVGFLWLSFGEPLAFARVQSAPGWDHVPGWSTWLKFGFFKFMAGDGIPAHKLKFLLHALSAVVPLVLAWPMRRRLGYGYALYVAGVVGIPALAMKDFWGMGRYALAAFPVFLYLAIALEERPRTRRALIAASTVLFVMFALDFGRGAWVA